MTTASEPEFYEQLEERRPGLAPVLRPFLVSLEELGVTPEFRKSVNLRWRPSADMMGALGYIDVEGRTWLSGACGTANRIGKTEAGEQYLQELAEIVGEKVRHYENAWPDVVDAKGRAADASILLAAGERWKEAMTRFITALRKDIT